MASPIGGNQVGTYRPNQYGAANVSGAAPAAAFQSTFSPPSSGTSTTLAGRANPLIQTTTLGSLMSSINDSMKMSFDVRDKNAVLVAGNTGAGKSTFCNWALGKVITRKDSALRAEV